MWYVMQVRTGTEENIRCQCQRLISSNVLERCFIPYYQQKKRFQGEWHIQERILFPGYVFLIAENLEQLVNELKKVIGLIKIIGTGMSGKWTQKGYRVDETDWNWRSDCPAGAGRSRIAYENRYRQTAC